MPGRRWRSGTRSAHSLCWSARTSLPLPVLQRLSLRPTFLGSSFRPAEPALRHEDGCEWSSGTATRRAGGRDRWCFAVHHPRVVQSAGACGVPSAQSRGRPQVSADVMVPAIRRSAALTTGTPRPRGTSRRPGRASKAPALRQDSFLKGDNFF